MKVLALLSLLIFSFETSAQTIADIARKERARQKQFQEQNRRTYTNATATVAPAPPRPAESAAGETTPAVKTDAAPAEPAGPVDNQGRGEKYWRDQFQKTREDLRRAEEKVQLLEARVKELNTQLLNRSDIYNRENRIGAEITAAQKDLDAARIEAEQARNKISNFEEELRGAGGLPGWAR